MRLTLRTLLAWLDNLLPQQEQRDLGDKVAASEIAPLLVRRIRETVARSTLPAPRVDGRGLAEDPNKAAEYLENTLEQDLLGAFERVCLESDVHLAEIAACHAVLADLIRTPGLVPPLAAEDKKRLLRAVQHHLETPRETEREAVVADGRAVRSALVAATPEPCDTQFVAPGTLVKSEPRRAAVPAADSEGKRRSRRAAWLTLAAATAVLLTLIGVLVWSLSGATRREIAVARPAPAAAKPEEPSFEPEELAAKPETPAVRPPSAGPAKPQPDAVTAVIPPQSASAAAKTPPAATDSSPQSPAAAAEPGAAKAAAQPADRPALPVGSPDPPPAVEKPAPVATTPPQQPVAAVSPPEQPRVPQGDALAIAAAPAATVPGTSAPSQPPPVGAAAVLTPPAAVVAEAGTGIVLERGLLLSRDPANPEQGRFEAVPVGGAVGPGTDLLVPAACRPVVSVGGVQVELEPSSRLRVTLDPDGTPRLDLLFGSATAQSPAAAARLGIAAGGLVGVITAGLRGPVGIEVRLALDPGADPATAESRTTARIVTGSSAIAWQQTQADGTPAREPLQGIAPQGMLDTASALVWDSRDPGGVVVERRPTNAWRPGQVRSTSIDDAAAVRLTAAVGAGKPVEDALRGLLGDRRAENRMAAAATLALLGEYGPLVDQLCAEPLATRLKESEWSRFEESTVPLALARGAKSAGRLQQAFEAKFPADTAADLLRLARGVTPAALEGDDGQRIVELLEDERLVVRRYAFQTLVEIVQPDAFDLARYRPDGLPEQRRDGAKWWRSRLADGRIRDAATRGDSGARPAE